ncbi:hypothetical protein [Streptomyces sp. NPDC007083]
MRSSVPDQRAGHRPGDASSSRARTYGLFETGLAAILDGVSRLVEGR